MHKKIPSSSIFEFFTVGIFLLVVVMAGYVSVSAAHATLLTKVAQNPSSAVDVKVNLPVSHALTGKTIVTLEDISVQDVAAGEIARLVIPTSELMANQGLVTIPIGTRSDMLTTSINAAVLVDVDDNGIVSDGDWMSDSIVIVSLGSTAVFTIDLVQITH